MHAIFSFLIQLEHLVARSVADVELEIVEDRDRLHKSDLLQLFLSGRSQRNSPLEGVDEAESLPEEDPNIISDEEGQVQSGELFEPLRHVLQKLVTGLWGGLVRFDC